MIPRQIALYASLGAAVVIALLLAWALRLDSLRAGYKASLATTIARYEKAQKDAQADFDLKVTAMRARNEELNHAADIQDTATRTVFVDRVMRLPSVKSDSCSAQLPAPNDAKGADGLGADSVILARSDALICSDNTARLTSAHDWAIMMTKGN